MNEGTQGLSTNARGKNGQRAAKHPYPQIALQNDKGRYAVTVFKKNRAELFSFWRDFKNLPLFMKDIQSVETVSGKTSKWTLKLENGSTAQWTAEITREVAGEEISWKSTDDSEVKTNGTVWFADGDNEKSSVVGMTMNYQIPGGKLTEIFTLFNGEDPKSLAKQSLKRFKALMETGEIPTIDGQADGREGEIK